MPYEISGVDTYERSMLLGCKLIIPVIFKICKIYVFVVYDMPVVLVVYFVYYDLVVNILIIQSQVYIWEANNCI